MMELSVAWEREGPGWRIAPLHWWGWVTWWIPGWPTAFVWWDPRYGTKAQARAFGREEGL